MGTVFLRKKREKQRERWRRCASVVIEPNKRLGINVEACRRSMYELGADGWIFDAMDASKAEGKELCIDRQINDLLTLDSSVHVTLGGIKLTF